MTSLLAGSSSAAPRPPTSQRRPGDPRAAGARRRRSAASPRPGDPAGLPGGRRSSAGSSPTRAPTGRRATALRVGALGWLTGPRLRRPRRRRGRSPSSRSASPRSRAWAIWRLGHRVGDSVSGHGPDADRIADGERDWTVPIAAAALHRRLRRRGGRHRDPGGHAGDRPAAGRGSCCGRSCCAAPSGGPAHRDRLRPRRDLGGASCRRGRAPPARLPPDPAAAWLVVVALAPSWSRWSSTSAPRST